MTASTLPRSSSSFAGFLANAGPIGHQILHHDWRPTSLGPIDTWPDALRTTLRTVLMSKQAISFYWGDELYQFYNDAYEPLLQTRVEGALGAPFWEFWAEVAEGVRPYVEQALAGTGTWIENLPLAMTRTGLQEETFWTFSYSPLFDGDEEIVGFMNVVTETTLAVRALRHERTEYERLKHAERLRADLAREMAHRLKNSLAIVQAIISQTFRQATTIEEGKEAITGRIAALAKAQDILTANEWSKSNIGEIVDGALAPHRDGDDRFHASGPDAELTQQQSLGLSLTLHELATNAAKYGALSAPDGRVTIEWSVGTDNEFALQWIEAGGPVVVTPVRRGFGSRLVERMVSPYFDGTTQLLFEPSGVVFKLDGRLASSQS